MHDSVMEYVKEMVDKYELSSNSVLELGSLNINGSVRKYFTGEYIGTDMQEGPGVDQVINAHDIIDTSKFDVIISTEMLEHDDAPWLTCMQALRATKPGGYFIVTARGYRGTDHSDTECFMVHGYPEDYWRYSVEGMVKLLEWAGWTIIDAREDPGAIGVFVTGRYDHCLVS